MLNVTFYPRDLRHKPLERPGHWSQSICQSEMLQRFANLKIKGLSKSLTLQLGNQYLDIREYFQTAKGFMPGKKGVTMKKSQWQAFRDAFFDIDEKCVSSSSTRLFESNWHFVRPVPGARMRNQWIWAVINASPSLSSRWIKLKAAQCDCKLD